MMLLHICTDYIWNNLYYELISRLQKNNIDNIVYVPINKKLKLTDKKRNEEYKVITSKVYNEIDRFFFRKKEKSILKDIQKKVDFGQINMIHAHTLFSAGYIAYKLNEKYNINYIVTVRNTDINVFLKYRKCLYNVGLNILKNAQKIIFISENSKKELFEKYIPLNIKQELLEKTAVIFNGIEEFWLKNTSKPKNINDKKNIELIQIGRLNKNKNFKTTIKVFKKLQKNGYKVKLNIIGQGKQENRLKRFAKNEKNIIFYGQLDKENIIKILRKSDIFILPSKHETFGLVYAEALSQGLPIIYTKGQGFDGILEEGQVGYCVKYNSVNEIIKKIEKIIDNYKEISENACEASKMFSWDSIAEEYKKIYN